MDPTPSRTSGAHSTSISNVSAWVLRSGVIGSALVMLIGIIFTFAHGTISVDRMKSDGFEYRPDVIWNGIRHGHGKYIIEAGIYLLLFTPIMRVAASSILFAFQERDRLYALITLIVLILTLAGLLWIG
ncbi:MAG TPA: DUF1634 domain-containing protein [Tepidisphaeraceae bacterium]|jgi:uncharacterized membrane protein|nr:DUF1634 domain-containing protein [Tepidisphaeraceae bacterium]